MYPQAYINLFKVLLGLVVLIILVSYTLVIIYIHNDRKYKRFHDFFSKQEMTQKEKIQKRIILKNQVRKVYESKLFLECSACKKNIPTIYMYKCFECGIWFCSMCAEKHFYPKVTKE